MGDGWGMLSARGGSTPNPLRAPWALYHFATSGVLVFGLVSHKMFYTVMDTEITVATFNVLAKEIISGPEYKLWGASVPPPLNMPKCGVLHVNFGESVTPFSLPFFVILMIIVLSYGCFYALYNKSLIGDSWRFIVSSCIRDGDCDVLFRIIGRGRLIFLLNCKLT